MQRSIELPSGGAIGEAAPWGGMVYGICYHRSCVRPERRRAVFALLFAVGALVGSQALASAHAPRIHLSGHLLSGEKPLAGVPVTLYQTSADRGTPIPLGRAVSRENGSFKISYAVLQRPNSVLYVVAARAGSVRLASVIPGPSVDRAVVVNERTTVATGFALAQFIAGRKISGKSPGLQNAATMATDLVDIRTGSLAEVLRTRPNGSQTSTLRTFNTLSNMLVPCVRALGHCRRLFRLATAPGGTAPRGTLAAVAEIARNPWHNVDRLFALARSGAAPYRPALRRSKRPDAWTLALRFDGDGKTVSGPGNIAVDARGNLWVTNNYVYSRNPLAPVCGSQLLLKFTPAGRFAKGSPYSGGGLNGAGFGITLDPRGHIWVGNFGFASVNCRHQPPHNSVSEFSLSGKPLSPSASKQSTGGFTQGGVSWPQGTVADKKGNIWIANCGNNTITRYASGNPMAEKSLGSLGIEKPFDIALNGKGQAFITGNGNNKVAVLNNDGSPTAGSPVAGGGLNKPMGIASDSRGNMWIANSGVVDVPCPDGGLSTTGKGGSVTLIRADGAAQGKAFTGGGLTIPWGVAVDGNDDVWVANFGGKRLSEFCGVHTARCPRGVRTGEAITPPSGYGFNGLVRNTGVQVDPSGNVWLANNWKTFPIPTANPGGYQLVVYIGLAGPIRTPLIGPPHHL